ncbi:MAG: glycosyltransferase [Saprospiraceae bacterium]|nr:glycosyltransferase [Saprospiraceae bacterium]
MDNNTTIYAIVTNDLVQDQRMHRICQTLQIAGYEVTLLGREKPSSKPLPESTYTRLRIRCIWQRGPLFYMEFCLRCFFWLLRQKKGIIWSVDTDTILAATLVSKARNMPVVWDAHEYFTEVPELAERPLTKWIWNSAERLCVPSCHAFVTVSPSLAKLFQQKYHKSFLTILNVPVWQQRPLHAIENEDKKILLYQGMLNKGRGLEQIIAAMEFLPEAELWIVGEGDLSQTLREQANRSKASGRIAFVGWKSGAALEEITSKASLGLNLLDGASLSYRYSLANKFFDYMHVGVPSVNMAFADYEALLQKYRTGICVSNLNPASLATEIQKVLSSPQTLHSLRSQCIAGAKEFCWQNQIPMLLSTMETLQPK